MYERDRTLRESLENVRNKDDFWYAIMNFLDRFKAKPVCEWLEDEPEIFAGRFEGGDWADAFTGAVADHLARSRQFQTPAWANRETRVMKKPCFAARSPNLKAILLQESPAAFRVRNLFVSANALSRA